MKDSIMIATSSRTLSLMIKKSLILNGYRVEVSFDGLAALSKIFEIHPSIIILDLDISKLKAQLICEAIKSDNKLSEVSIIIIGAKNIENLQEFKKFNISSYIQIPFTVKELIEKIISLE